jgi:hypothetical protein
MYSFPSTEKKAAAQKAEADFFALLKEHSEIKSGVVWKEVFPEFLCVGSSLQR